MHATGVVLSLLLAALLLLTGGGKVTRSESSHGIRDALAVPALLWLLTGAFELLIVAALILGVWQEPAGLAGLVGVVALMAGAIITRLRAPKPRDPRGVVADAVVLAIAVVAAILRLV